MRRALATALVAALLASALVAALLALAGPVPPVLAQAGPPSAEGATDLRADKLSMPREDDARPGRVVGLPLALGACAILGVVVVAVVRSRRAHVGDGQLSDGSAGR